MRIARLVAGTILVGLVIGAACMSACRKTGSELTGSTYCDPNAGSSLVQMSSLPSGSCKGTSTCIAFAAGEACTADPAIPTPDCEWTCTCLDDTWTCSASCENNGCPEDGGSTSDGGGVVDASDTD